MVDLNTTVEKPAVYSGLSEDERQLVAVLKAVADNNRLAILGILRKAELCVCEVVDILQLPQNLVSHHLSVLKKAGLVTSRRDEEDSRWIYYSLNTEALAAHFQEYQAFFAPEKATLDLDEIDREAIVARWQQANGKAAPRRGSKRACSLK